MSVREDMLKLGLALLDCRSAIFDMLLFFLLIGRFGIFHSFRNTLVVSEIAFWLFSF